ncbi:MAG: hypothetical protein M1503_08910 [Thaumarchaeota archaeon]|nr:hypothetical protein [Nitrososphaerota archaeon]MCL5318357.1 hypothetical protein [Nitrososphaerota archaeon]
MSISMALFPLLALALGLKHAYDADHLVAVSNFLTRSSGLRDTSRMTLSWAIGHMATAAIITTVLFVLASQAEQVTGLLSVFELGVAIMLIAIGVVAVLMEVPLFHSHLHTHPDGTVHSHSHRHRFGRLGGFARRTHLHHSLFGIGIIHGLASNDELLLLFVAGLGVGSLELLLGGVAVFTIGVMLGMMLFGFAVTSLYRHKLQRVRMMFNLTIALLSIAYGGLLLIGLDGFNVMALLFGQ